MIKKILVLSLFFISISNVLSQVNNDFDSDGVINKFDLDDDNDGILDKIENNRKKIFVNQWRNRINVKTIYNNLIFKKGGRGWANTVNSPSFSVLGFKDTYELKFQSKGTAAAVIGLGLEETGNGFEDVDYAFSFKDNYFKVLKNGVEQTPKCYYRKRDWLRVVYKKGELLFFQNKILIKKFAVSKGLDFYLDSSFNNTFVKKPRYGRSRYYRYSNYRSYGYLKKTAIFSNMIISSVGNLDSDNDGIINSLDLDSDGDGCFDVVEAGFTDEDGDGFFGEGKPTVDRRGRVIRCVYNLINNDYLDPDVKICPDEEVYGIYVNTVNLKKSNFNIEYNNTVVEENLESGNPNSRFFVDLGENDGQEKQFTINVFSGDNNREQQFRLTILDASVTNVEVFNSLKNEWLKLAPEFYRLKEQEIAFENNLVSPVSSSPFNLNLINGVQYNNTAALVLTVDENFDISNASLDIIAPDNSTVKVSPNTSGNTFTWDGVNANEGSYKFILNLQNQSFLGHFIIL